MAQAEALKSSYLPLPIFPERHNRMAFGVIPADGVSVRDSLRPICRRRPVVPAAAISGFSSSI